MLFFCLVLLLVVVLGCYRVFIGPSLADRLLGVQLIGTTVTGILLVFAEWQGEPALRHVALVLALLAAAIIAALVQRLRGLADG